ncbi:MAG: cytochrome c [Chloroflexus sp.]|jgi:cytochrome c|nr:cytochrome c [Chloroflexus sp.]MBO9374480.1 cytochrome c [Chloroflexus sp.]
MQKVFYWMYVLTLSTILAACASTTHTSSTGPDPSNQAVAVISQPATADQGNAANQVVALNNSAAAAKVVDAALPPVLADRSLSAKGDPNRGKTIFTSCAGCHSPSTTMLLGPGLAGLFSIEGPKLPDGVDYQGLLPNGKERSEANIAEWIRTGGSGSIGYMPPMPLTDEQMADLMAYLRTLE